MRFDGLDAFVLVVVRRNRKDWLALLLGGIVWCWDAELRNPKIRSFDGFLCLCVGILMSLFVLVGQLGSFLIVVSNDGTSC